MLILLRILNFCPVFGLLALVLQLTPSAKILTLAV